MKQELSVSELNFSFPNNFSSWILNYEKLSTYIIVERRYPLHLSDLISAVVVYLYGVLFQYNSLSKVKYRKIHRSVSLSIKKYALYLTEIVVKNKNIKERRTMFSISESNRNEQSACSIITEEFRIFTFNNNTRRVMGGWRDYRLFILWRTTIGLCDSMRNYFCNVVTVAVRTHFSTRNVPLWDPNNWCNSSHSLPPSILSEIRFG